VITRESSPPSGIAGDSRIYNLCDDEGVGATMRHTIIAVDIAGFGTRSEEYQQILRDGLRRLVRQAFGHCGLRWKDCVHRDQGDGMLVLAPVDVENKRLVECLPHELAGRLREFNATAADEGRIRLRVVLHSGELGMDESGPTGEPLVIASRLLESQTLKDALAGSRGNLALITSLGFYHDVIEHWPAANPGIYRRVRVTNKETKTDAWICLPDDQALRDPPPAPQPVRPAQPRVRVVLPKVRLSLSVLTLTGLLVLGGVSGAFAAVPADAGCGEPVQVNVSVSAEKAVVIRKLMPSFEEWARDEDRCEAVSVQVTVARSADLIAALGRGWGDARDLQNVGPEPHVVLADSSWEIDAAAAALFRNELTRTVELRTLGPIASLAAGARPARAARVGRRGRPAPHLAPGAGRRRPSAAGTRRHGGAQAEPDRLRHRAGRDRRAVLRGAQPGPDRHHAHRR
jgi:hypothetical protein